MAKAKKKKKESHFCILTVTGKDQVGIIARVSSVMAGMKINIVDVSQKIIGQYFVMTMGCDMTDSTAKMEDIHKELGDISKEMDLNITFQDENIFKVMHRV